MKKLLKNVIGLKIDLPYPSFPCKRESRTVSSQKTKGLDSRLRGNDGEKGIPRPLVPVSNQRGIILIISLMVLLAMTALGMMVFYTSVVDFKIAGNERSSRVAYYAAQAGLTDAKKRLEVNTSDTTGDPAYCTPDPVTGDVADSNCDLLDPDWQLSGSITGTLPNDASYEVSITHVSLYNGTDWTVLRGEDSDWWPYYRVTSTGTYLDTKKTIEEYSYLSIAEVWTKAVTACGDLEVANNGGTDSYDSDAGEYDEGSAGSAGDIFVDGTVTLDNNAGFNGSITATGSITLANNAIVIGSLTSGSNISLLNNAEVAGDITSTKSSGEAVTVDSGAEDIPGTVTIQTGATVSDPGSHILNPATATLAPIESPEACDPANRLEIPSDIATPGGNNNSNMTRSNDGNPTCDDNWDNECLTGGCCNLCPSGETFTLPGGTEENPEKYYFQSLTTENNVKLVTTGYVEIYVNGDINLIGNNAVFCGDVAAADCWVQDSPTVYRPDSAPEELFLYGYGQSRDGACNQLGTDFTVTVDNNNHLFGKIYAPEASMTIIDNNAQVYGAVIAGGMSQAESGGMDNNAGVHYDAALADQGKRVATARVLKRKECYYGTLVVNSVGAGEYYAAGACRLTP